MLYLLEARIARRPLPRQTHLNGSRYLIKGSDREVNCFPQTLFGVGNAEMVPWNFGGIRMGRTVKEHLLCSQGGSLCIVELQFGRTHEGSP